MVYFHFVFVPFLLRKDKLYMCMDLLKGQKWVFVLPSVWRTLRERLSVLWETLLAKPLEILAGFWKAESDRTEITFDVTETLCVPKTISEDGAASWISGCCFGCVRVDFCMWWIHCTSIRRSILAFPGSVFQKVIIRRDQIWIYMVYIWITSLPSCWSHN